MVIDKQSGDFTNNRPFQCLVTSERPVSRSLPRFLQSDPMWKWSIPLEHMDAPKIQRNLYFGLFSHWSQLSIITMAKRFCSSRIFLWENTQRHIATQCWNMFSWSTFTFSHDLCMLLLQEHTVQYFFGWTTALKKTKITLGSFPCALFTVYQHWGWPFLVWDVRSDTHASNYCKGCNAYSVTVCKLNMNSVFIIY